MKHRGFKRYMEIVMMITLIVVCVLFIVRDPAAQAEVTGDSGGLGLIYSSDNPVPQIAADVRPAVVKVIAMRNRAQEVGYGSGVYVDARGYIVTNSHVVFGASAVDIQLLDGTRIPVAEFFQDEDTDLAVLKIDQPLDATPVPFGNSDELMIGELAIAIGNPGADGSTFFGTVTAGIISGLDRESFSGTSFNRSVKVIQTDAAINFGNSGGALLNRRGELIGIPTLKIASTWYSSYENLGFAIPINTVRPILNDLIEFGVVRRPRLGVEVVAQDGPDRGMRRYPPAGMKIELLLPGSPAEEAGVKRFDIITHVDGVRIRTFIELSRELDLRAAGDQVTLSISRYFDDETGEPLANAETLEIIVTLKIIED